MVQNSMLVPIHAIDAKEISSLGDHARAPRFTSKLYGEQQEPKEFRIPGSPEARLVSINDPGAYGAELLRTLAGRLRLLQKRQPLKKLLVTSALPGEGKTLISANLSVTLALHQKRVLLIDGDLRSASLSRSFDIVDHSFVSDWRDEGPHHLPLLRKANGLPLWVIPAGRPVEIPSKILQTSEFGAALEAIEPDFDWIIMDSPPLIPFGDAGVLASFTDAVVLVARKGVTTKNAFRDGLKSIDKNKIIATIFNCADVESHKYYREYYSHLRGVLPVPGQHAE